MQARVPQTEKQGAVFPRWFLMGASALVLSSVVVAGIGSLTGVGVSRIDQSLVESKLLIRFVEMPDSSMRIVRAEDDAELAVLASDGSGFMRGIARSLFRQRMLGGVEKHEPFELARRVDGKHFIVDPALAHLTGNRIELDGFGPTNSQSVAAILNAGIVRQSSGLNKQPSDQNPVSLRNAAATQGRTQ